VLQRYTLASFGIRITQISTLDFIVIHMLGAPLFVEPNILSVGHISSIFVIDNIKMGIFSEVWVLLRGWSHLFLLVGHVIQQDMKR
jgi:hypothetical protein